MIICVGIATANSILVIAAREGWQAENLPWMQHESWLQNASALVAIDSAAPYAILAWCRWLWRQVVRARRMLLGRTVIGGLAYSTTATLVLVPVFFLPTVAMDGRPQPVKQSATLRERPWHDA